MIFIEIFFKVFASVRFMEEISLECCRIIKGDQNFYMLDIRCASE